MATCPRQDRLARAGLERPIWGRRRVPPGCTASPIQVEEQDRPLLHAGRKARQPGQPQTAGHATRKRRASKQTFGTAKCTANHPTIGTQHPHPASGKQTQIYADYDRLPSLPPSLSFPLLQHSLSLTRPPSSLSLSSSLSAFLSPLLTLPSSLSLSIHPSLPIPPPPPSLYIYAHTLR